MKNGMIKVGAAVPGLRVCDVEGNVDEIISLMERNRGCGVIAFPELCVTGYTCADLFGNERLLSAAEKGLMRIAEASRNLPGLTAVVGLPLAHRNSLYNCAAFVSEGKIAAIVPKINLPTYSEFYESRWFCGGHHRVEEISFAGQRTFFGTRIILSDGESGACLASEICEDLWVADKPSTHACLAGAAIIVNPSASDETIGKENYRRNLVMQQSAACYCAYVYSSSGVGESSTDLVFSGHAMIAENGNLIRDRIFSEESFVETAIIDLETIAFNRRHQNTYGNDESTEYIFLPVHIQPVSGKNEITSEELHEVLENEGHFVARNPFIPKDDMELEKRCAEILRIQANGLASRVKSTGIKNLVIGVSGGLDSTLALLVCHEAQKIVKDIRIIAYTMPSRGNTTSRTYTNAISLMKCLGADCREIPIEKGVTDHLVALGHGGAYKGEGDVTYENAQARMRTYILMNAANMENGLVVGTGDLSELALGWCTYNGDHMSMYAVNSSVPKTLVKYICRAYSATCGDSVLSGVLESIIETPISPELTPNNNDDIAQKTEDKIGKYDLNDFFLFHTLRYGFGPEKIIAFARIAYPEMEIECLKEKLKSFYRRFFSQQFKRSCLPDGPKVGSVSLSPRGDWRMPSDASARLWMESL